MQGKDRQGLHAHATVLLWYKLPSETCDEASLWSVCPSALHYFSNRH